MKLNVNKLWVILFKIFIYQNLFKIVRRTLLKVWFCLHVHISLICTNFKIFLYLNVLDSSVKFFVR